VSDDVKVSAPAVYEPGDENRLEELAEEATKGVMALMRYAVANGVHTGRMSTVVATVAAPIGTFAKHFMEGHPLYEPFERLPIFLAGQAEGWAFAIGQTEEAGTDD
jgi:hypothetical protein